MYLSKEPTNPRAFVFDAYGTLFDVHSVVVRTANLPGDLQTLSAVWRQKQLEYTWFAIVHAALPGLMRCYRGRIACGCHAN